MKIINASKVNKLNSQITCTSYYDFLTQKRQCLKALNCDPPRKTEIGDQFGSAMESAKYYEVDDKAAEWYLGTRASSVKKCSSTSQVPIRQRNLMATSHSVPGQRVSPEFLGLLQQHHARMGEHLLHNCRRPRINSSYYKYNAKGKRRHMRPGIDTAAPLEFPYHMEKDGLEYRKRLLRGQEIVIGPPAPLRSEEKPNSHGRYPFSPRTKRNKKRHAMKKCNQNNNINAKALKFLKVDNLEFPSTTEEDRDCSCNTYQKKRSPKDLNNNDNLQESMETKTDNHRLHTCNPSVLKPPHTSSPSVPKPPHLNETSQLINSTDQSTMCTCPSGKEAIPTIPTDKPKKNLLIKYVNTAFFKAMQGWRGAFPRNDSSRHSRYSQTPSDGNNKMEKFPTCRKIALESSGCKKHSVEGILSKRPCSKEPAFNSDFCQKKKVRIAISKCSTSVPDQKGSRLAKRDDNIPKIRGHCPDNSVKPLPCKVSPCTRSVAQPSCDHHLETNQSRKRSHG
ncbi:uncharacterized protein [Drosophila kikkawai]|uniref:Uncharacterized protein n=1 Tax=Drosophila kikkawai TaxID=30033 RepID=A0ABM4G9M8_DROKI